MASANSEKACRIRFVWIRVNTAPSLKSSSYESDRAQLIKRTNAASINRIWGIFIRCLQVSNSALNWTEVRCKKHQNDGSVRSVDIGKNCTRDLKVGFGFTTNLNSITDPEFERRTFITSNAMFSPSRSQSSQSTSQSDFRISNWSCLLRLFPACY